jgi:hypothetical protein
MYELSYCKVSGELKNFKGNKLNDKHVLGGTERGEYLHWIYHVEFYYFIISYFHSSKTKFSDIRV